MTCSAETIETLIRKNACEWSNQKACDVWTSVAPTDKVSEWVMPEAIQDAVMGDTRAEMFGSDCKSPTWPDGWADMAIKDLAEFLAENGEDI